MKFCLFLFLMTCFLCRLQAQADTIIHYRGTQNAISFDYPAEWDTTYLTKLKARLGENGMNLIFGALIKPDFLANGKGASVVMTATTLPHKPDSAEMVMMKKNAEDYYKSSADGKLEYFAFSKTKKTGLPCIVSILKSDYRGLQVYQYTFEIYKGKVKYMFGLNSHELAYPKLKEPFERVINTFE